MDNQVELAISEALQYFEAASSNEFKATITSVFNSEEDFMAKVDGLDKAFDEAPAFEALREVFFDLLMINFFSQDVQKLEEDYLDSPEWEEIEEETIDRGTELLNVLLYIRECQDEDIEPELEDFLKEFLLVEEDEFQDEHRIYEDVIAHQILMESDFAEIGKVAKQVSATSEIKEVFYPLMAFFYQNQPSEEDLVEFKNNAADPAFETAVYKLLVAYNQ